MRVDEVTFRPAPPAQWDYPTAFSVWGEEEHDAIQRVLRSGRLTQGEEVAAFEREFAAYHNMKHCVAVNSGSSANLVMIAALTHLKGYHILTRRAYVPAIAWSTTYAPLIQRGFELTLVDVDVTWNANLSGLPRNEPITPGSVVVGCSILGNPTWALLWNQAAWHAGAYYVEDNCESFGAYDPHGWLCGTVGLMNTFSFFWSHQISAVEGGAILTNDDECARLCRMLRAHGWTRDVRGTTLGPFEEEYDFHLPGYNVRWLEMHAAIARVQLRKAVSMQMQRAQNARFFYEEAHKRGLAILSPFFNGKPNSFGLHFQLASNEARTRVVMALRANRVDCRLPTGGSFRRHPYAAQWAHQQTPNADGIHDTGLFLGNGPIDLSEQIDRALKIIKEAA